MANTKTNLTDNPVWQAYANAILRKALATGSVDGGFDSDRQHFSIGSALLSMDVSNADAAQANTSVFVLANSIPARTGAYVANGDFFMTYWLYLNYAMMGQKHPVFSELGNEQLTGPIKRLVFPAPQRSARTAGSILTGWLKKTRLLPDPGRRLSESANNCLTASDSAGPNSLNMPVVLSEGTVHSFAPRYNLLNMKAVQDKWHTNVASGNNTVINILNADDEKDSRKAVPELFPFWGVDMNPVHALDTSRANWHIFATFDGLDAVKIVAGDWFQSDLIDAFMKMLPPNAPRFFGESGSMSLLPEYAIFGYHPGVTINSETRIAHDAWVRVLSDQHISNKRIGPFAVPESGQNDGILLINHDDLIITIDGTSSDIPVLMGMISRKLG